MDDAGNLHNLVTEAVKDDVFADGKARKSPPANSGLAWPR